jgi:hypothetical protein
MSPDEQEFARLLAGSTDVVINRQPGLLSHLEPDRLTGLLLPHRRSIEGVSTGSNILDPEGDNIATAQFAIGGKIEHGQVAGLSLDLKLRSDGPDML